MSVASTLDSLVHDASDCASNGHPLTVDVSRYTRLQPCVTAMCACGLMAASRIGGEIITAIGHAAVKAMFAN